MELGSEKRILEQMIQAKESLQKGIESCDKFINNEAFKGLMHGLLNMENIIKQQEKKIKMLEQNQNRPYVIIQNNLSHHIDK